MESVTLSRRVDADPDTVEDAMADLEPFLAASGFDDVTVDDGRIHIENRVGVFGIELDLEVIDREGTVLAYRQRDGIFREMATEYELEPVAGGTEVTARTDFEVAARFAGPVLDATVIKRQRKRELRGQFDYLDALPAE